LQSTMNSSNSKNRHFLSKYSHKQLLAIVVGIGLLMAAVMSYIFLDLKLLSDRNLSGAPKNLFSGRNFKLQPFTLMDANDVCELKSKEQLGASLLRYTMNPLSTRYQEDKNSYFVVLDADIGTIDLWEEIMIFCDVDPRSHEVSHYKVVYGDDESIFLKAKNIFKKMVE